MRTDYIYRYWGNFGEGGFKRLIGEGSFQRDAHYNYMPTVTGPGHASIYTGTTPSHHGIVANERYDRHSRRTIYCVADTAVRGVATASGNGLRSPVQLLASTLADELELRFDGKARTVGIALKDRSAILPVGRTGDAAYWFSGGSEGRFITSTWYMKQLPAWVEAFNAQGLAEQYLARTWSPLLPRERYHTALPDDNTYEIPIARGIPATLPVNLDSLRKAGAGLDLLTYTPWGNTITTDMALAALDGEGMGADAFTDLLAVSYSSPDILGHRVGPRALEEEDMYIRLDGEIARLLAELDKRVGAGEYTVFLTADHGVVDVPQWLKDRKGSAGYVDVHAAAEEVIRSMPAQVSGGTAWLDTVVDGQIFFGGSQWSTAYFAEQLMQKPGFACVYPVEQLRSASGDRLPELMRNGCMPQRCGDILYALLPGHVEKETWSDGHGTTHGSGWNYDTQVPVILYGKGVRTGEVLEPTTITDIVPTICAIVGVTLPDAATGVVVAGSLLGH
jgi:predicted AlkP superfamily pyrophosphatase or phosphodiesterase